MRRWRASLLPADTPAHIRTLIGRCLKKDPRERLHSIAGRWATSGRVLGDPPVEISGTDGLRAIPSAQQDLILGRAPRGPIGTAPATCTATPCCRAIGKPTCPRATAGRTRCRPGSGARCARRARSVRRRARERRDGAPVAVQEFGKAVTRRIAGRAHGQAFFQQFFFKSRKFNNI